MSGFSNFAISFTIISILSGTLTLYGTGLNYGGPVMEAYGWPIVSVFVIIVGLGMAEIASKYPTAGGLYYWASKMGGPAWGWFTGWFNLIGLVAVTASVDYGCATFMNVTFGAFNFNLGVSLREGGHHCRVGALRDVSGAVRAEAHRPGRLRRGGRRTSAGLRR